MKMFVIFAISFILLTASGKVYGDASALTSNIVPEIDSTGSSGSCSLSLNQAAKTAVVTSKVNTIKDMTAGHIHIAPAGQNGPVVVPIYSEVVGTGTFSFTKKIQASDLSPEALGLSGSATPSDAFNAFVKALNSHNLYCNYHTKVNPGGELRAQL